MTTAIGERRRDLSVVIAPTVIAAVLGPAAGLAWGLWVPGIDGVVTADGRALVRQGELDNFFLATAAFVALCTVGGLLTAALLFRGSHRTPGRIAMVFVASVVAVALAAVVGQAVADARFAGPGGAGLDYTAAPTIRLDGANFLAVANHPGGVIGDLAPWVTVLVWPAMAGLWCAVVAAFSR